MWPDALLEQCLYAKPRTLTGLVYPTHTKWSSGCDQRRGDE